ncbi:MAG: type II toxin-antitoxin system Phd/YefM family antitoxin [Alphaproteobacteria bacterium]
MREVDAFDAGLGKLLDLLEQGEEIVIIRRVKAVARMVPLDASMDRQAARAAVHRIRERAERLKSGPFVWSEWKAYRDAGRL